MDRGRLTFMKQLTLTTRFTIVLSGLLALVLCSCESDAFFTVPNGDTKLFAYSEISPENEISVFVNTAVGINSDDEFLYPGQTDAEVVLYEDGVRLDDPGFRYINSKGAFVSQGSFRPKPGVNYGLEVALKDNESIRSIYGETIIPFADTLEDVVLNTYDNSVEIDINLLNTDNEYFKIKTALFSSSGDAIDLEFDNALFAGNGITVMNNNEILISKEKLEGQIKVFGEALEGISGGRLEISLQSITKEAYTYHKSQRLVASSQTSSLSEPVISHTNFENGLGLFAGYHTKTTVLDIL